MTKVNLPTDLIEGDIFHNIEIIRRRITAPNNTYTVKCNCCGHIADIYDHVMSVSRKCSKCNSKFYNKPTKQKDYSYLVGERVGEFTIIKADKTHLTYVCANGTEKVSPARTNLELRECRCRKCKPNIGFDLNKYGSQWGTLSKCKEVFWTDYMHFESWIDSNLPQPDRNHKILRKINEDGTWHPDNVWWATSPASHHITTWRKIIPVQENITLMYELKTRLYFKCTNNHTFSRLKGSILTRSKRDGYKIKCMECEKELSEKKFNDKRIRSTLSEQITNKHPTIKLVGDYKSKDEIGIFECCCCNTSYKMKISEMLYKQVCPICKSEEWGRKCDERVNNKFGGKIVRTGVWRLAELETTWKCLKHGTHFKKSYNKILPSVTGGCPDCINFTVPDPEAPTKMYYVRLAYDNTFFYKIGITQNTVENRFDREISKRKLVIIKEWNYPTWRDAYTEEQAIINIFKSDLLCKGEKPLKNTGNTEIFYYDVMELDHAKNY